MGLHRLTLALFVLVATGPPVHGQDTCRAQNETCSSQSSELCCNELQCASGASRTQQCSKCDNSVCIGADGLGICCAPGFICIPGVGCCPIDQSCETAGPNSQLTCCKAGTTCIDPATNTGPEVCVDCPASRVCEIQSASGALVKRCCPEGYLCDPVNRQCKAPCAPPLQPCNTPATDYCCPKGTYCSYSWPPILPLTETCCKKSQLCFNPAVHEPFCCPGNIACINGKCQDCPIGTQYCPLSGTCCKTDGSEVCVNSECCPKARVCGSQDQPTCCPAGYTCVNGVCKENTPPPCDTTQGLYQCWLNSTSWICCKQGLNCIPPPLGAVYADPYTACCDPTQTCLDFPSMTSKVCCGKPQTCLNMLYPSPGSVSADQTCCPEDNQCKWLDTTTSPPKPGKDKFCCATTCTPFDPANAASDKICCPKERYYEVPSNDGTPNVRKECCPPGYVYQPAADGTVGKCVEVKPPCRDPTPQVCPLGVPPNGTTVCCEQGTCYGGDIGCCKDQVCPVWPGTDPSNFKCCAAPEQCLPALYPSSIVVSSVGATPLCCPEDNICHELTNNGASKEQYCCGTFCVPNYQGQLIDICCPKDQVCGKSCCPPGVPCIDGQCCPEKHQCLDPVTGKKICCKEGKCTSDWLTGAPVCCGQPGSGTTICLAPSFPFKRTCCPSGYVCMSDGTCCPKKNYCYNPVTKKGTCCKDTQSCINGICCDKAQSDVCTLFPSLTGQQCCPKGNCLVAWNANPYPGAPVLPPVIRTCCPQDHACKPYLPSLTKGNICCMQDCLPLVTPLGKNVCCPKEKTCIKVNPDGTSTRTCCREKQECKSGKCCDQKNICKPYKPLNNSDTICCNKPSACMTLFGTDVGVCCSLKKQCLGPNNNIVCCKSNQSCQPVPGTNYNRCVP